MSVAISDVAVSVTPDDDESPPIYLRQIQIPIFPMPRHFSLHHLQLPLKSPPIVRKHGVSVMSVAISDVAVSLTGSTN
jgi:hypothetical protein